MTARRTASIAALVLASGCGHSPRPADVVVFASGSDLESANPLVTIHPLSLQVQRHVLFVTLVRYDSALALAPYYARSWQWSTDRREVRMRLEPGLRWQDGAPTTARDAAFTLRAARNPATGFARASDLSAVDSVFALDDTTLVIRFTTYQRELPQLLAELPILPVHILGRVPAADMRRAPFNTNPVGNGPFRFAGRTPGQQWTFSRNPDFPESMGGAPRIRELVIAVVDEPTTKFAGLASGDLDFAGIAPTMASLAERDPAIEVMDYPVLFSTAIVFNAQRAPFDDARVRRAIGLSIDRGRIVTAALAGYAEPAAGPVPRENPLAYPGSRAAPLDTRLADTRLADTRLADSLLDAAGYPRDEDGHRGITFELLTVGSGDNAVEQLVQADLAARGIRVEIRQLEMSAFLARARAQSKDFDALITGIPGDLSLAYLRAMFESAQRGGSLDYSGYHTPRLDALFARARDARTQSELHLAWVDIQREIAREAPAVWLYHSRGLQGVSSRMRNVVIDLRGELATVSRWLATT